jgi:phosphoglycolate phosphatase
VFGIVDSSKSISKSGRTDLEIIDMVAQANLNRWLSSDEIRLLNENYFKQLGIELAISKPIVLPNVAELLQSFSENPTIQLGLQTGNFREAAKIKLEAVGVWQKFTFGGFGDQFRDRARIVEYALGSRAASPHTGQEEVYVVGDSPGDILAGKSNRAITIAVATGSFTVSELVQYNPDFVFPHLNEEFIELFLGNQSH